MSETRDSVWPLVEEIRRATSVGLHTVALMGALALPDILAALGAPDGKTTGPKYRDWLVQHAGSTEAAAKEIYGLRCSLLHQGSAFPHKSDVRVAFVWPGNGLTVHNSAMKGPDETVHWYDIPMFVEEIAASTDAWLTKFGDTATVKGNLERFARFRPDGFPPYVVGFPVVA